MNPEIIAAILFIVLVSTFSFIKRKKFEMHGWFPFIYSALYRTKLGVVLMDKLASISKRFWKFIGYVGIVIGFLGMVVASWAIVQGLFKLITAPPAQQIQAISLVLPFNVKGALYIPFTFWITSLIIIVFLHELMHGIIARAHGMKIKASGFAFLGIFIPLIPAAFVEPDEKQLIKRPMGQQLSMFAAGGAINIFTALILAVILLPLTTVWEDISVANGVTIQSFDSLSPAKEAGLEVNDRIITIGDGADPGKGGTYYQVYNLQDFSDALSHYKPNSIVNIFASHNSDPTLRVAKVILLENPINKNTSYLGITVSASSEIKDEVKQRYGTVLPSLVIWFIKLLFWIFVLSFGIGLMNLAPIMPLDGGRMMQLVMFRMFKKKKHAAIAAGTITIVFLGALILSIVLGLVL